MSPWAADGVSRSNQYRCEAGLQTNAAAITLVMSAPGQRRWLWQSCRHRIFHDVAAFPGFRLVLDLGAQTVAYPDGSQIFSFEVDAFRKHSLLNGLDEIAITLQHAVEIKTFETKRRIEQPWLFS